MRVLILCLFLAGCSSGVTPALDGGPPADAEEADAGPLVCPPTEIECSRILFCGLLCHYAPDGGLEDAGADIDAGQDAGEPVDAGQDAGTCNPGVHTSACMDPSSCLGADHVCRRCCP